jgi:hypothetical protein
MGPAASGGGGRSAQGTNFPDSDACILQMITLITHPMQDSIQCGDFSHAIIVCFSVYSLLCNTIRYNK